MSKARLILPILGLANTDFAEIHKIKHLKVLKLNTVLLMLLKLLLSMLL